MTPEEISTARLHEIYSRTAAFYDEVVAAEQAATKRLASELLARQRGETFLEVAVGTAWCFRRIIEATGAHGAAGIDAATGMIDVARAALSEAHVNAPLVLADATRLPVRDASIDCALCTYTLEVLPMDDALLVLREMRRVVKANGRIVLAGLTEGEGDDAAFTDDWQRRYERDPEFFGGARPIRLTPLVEAAGLVVQERQYVGREVGWPSEVLVVGQRMAELSRTW